MRNIIEDKKFDVLKRKIDGLSHDKFTVLTNENDKDDWYENPVFDIVNSNGIILKDLDVEILFKNLRTYLSHIYLSWEIISVYDDYIFILCVYNNPFSEEEEKLYNLKIVKS